MRDKLEQLGAQMDALEAYGEERAADRFSGDTRLGRVAQTGTVLTVVTLGLTIVIGILIYDQIAHALPLETDSKDYANNSELENSAVNSTETFGDSMELAPVIMIILLASVVLAVVQRFR